MIMILLHAIIANSLSRPTSLYNLIYALLYCS